MTPKLKFCFLVVITILVADHITKYWIVQNVKFGDSIVVIDHIFEIVHTRNKGAAFGFLHDWQSEFRNAFFYGIGTIAFFFLIYFIKSTPFADKLSIFSFAMIAGGASGNLTDRLLRGSVVDFLYVHYYDKIWEFSFFGKDFQIPLSWPAFNVADSAISIAIILLLYRTIINPYKHLEKSL